MKKQHESMLYKPAIESYSEKGPYKYGPLTSGKLRTDPQYVMFQMARYKHACKLLYGKKNCIDIGSGDGVGLPLLGQHFDKVLALDVDEYLLNEAEANCEIEHVNFMHHDFFLSPITEKFECAVCFDVLSSIPPEKEKLFINNVAQSLTDDGCLIMGSQNKLATRFSNKENLVDQPNFKTFDELYDFLNLGFQNVIVLSMHDETIHTGKRETAQYFIGIGIGIKIGSN